MFGLRGLFAVVFGFAVAIAANSPGYAQDAASAPAERDIATSEQGVAVAPMARDAEIAQRIQNIMEATGWYRDVNVRVDDGVVFLEGQAAKEAQRAWAQNLATKTQDVVAVVNRVGVDPSAAWTLDPALNALSTLGRDFVQALPLIVLAVVLLPIAWLAAGAFRRMVGGMLASRIESPLLRDVVAWIIAAPVFLIALYVVLQAAGLTQLAVSLLGGAGVIGIVVGFAFRDIAENFLASLLLSMRRPFRPGDFIEVAGNSGIVRSMNTRSTIILSPEGNHIQVPNSTVFKNVITNYSAAPARRETLKVGVGYDASITDAQSIILDVLQNHAAVLKDPEPLVLVDALGSSTVNLDIHYWFDGQAYSQIKVRSALLRLTKRALMDAGISMPDDAREIIFPEGLPMIETKQAENGPQAGGAYPPVKSLPNEAVATATESEGDLRNERSEIEANAAASKAEDLEGDLLGTKP